MSSLVASLEAAFSSPSGGNGSGGRKSAKCGLDPEKARRIREDKLLQIRKSRRNELAMTQRRRVAETPEDEEDDEEEGRGENGGGNGFGGPRGADDGSAGGAAAQTPPVALRETQRVLLELPEKTASIMSADFQQQLDGIIYFRKLLAIPKKPPIENVMMAGVFPRIISFLSLDLDPQLQYEAAWCVTNIACGDPVFIAELISNGVLPAIVNIVSFTTDDKARSQALWALANLSADLADAGFFGRDHVIASGAISPVLWLLGIPDGTGRAPGPHPALGTMQHLTYIVANLSKGPPNLPVPFLRQLLHAMSDLLQSPDVEVCSIIASCISEMCDKSELYTQCILEHGILTRLHSLLQDPKSSDYSIRAFCSIMRSTNQLHARLACSSKYPHIFLAMLNKIASDSTNVGALDVTVETCVTIGRLMEDANYLTRLVSLDVIDALVAAIAKGKFDLMVQAGLCFCLIISNTTDNQVLVKCTGAMGQLALLVTLEHPDLQYLVLQAVSKLLAFVDSQALALQVDQTHFASLRNSLNQLANHPTLEISQAAEKLLDDSRRTEP